MNSRGKYRALANSLDGMNIGYITIPTGCERKDFIDTCMRRCKVMVYFDGGVFKQDVPITREALNNITFPDAPGELGSPVVGLLWIVGWDKIQCYPVYPWYDSDYDNDNYM
jgi:hypothetical protein